MNRHMTGTALAASLLMLQAGAAAAQNSTDPGATAPPPASSDRPSASTPPATTSEPPVRTEEPAPRAAPPTEIVPVIVQQPSAPAPIQLPADQPYPNGFADPMATYGNDLSVQVRESEGFDWGLLGLLGLFGLFGLYRRRDGYRSVVQSERYEDDRPPRR